MKSQPEYIDRMLARRMASVKYDIVGEHVKNYDFMINLAHYKGHQMGGFGGVLKNASIGVASTAGKAYIHSHGVTEKTPECWQHTQPQDVFIESMAMPPSMPMSARRRFRWKAVPSTAPVR